MFNFQVLVVVVVGVVAVVVAVVGHEAEVEVDHHAVEQAYFKSKCKLSHFVQSVARYF